MDPSQTTPQNPHHRHPLANYQFNSDELRVLRECNSESFFQRSLPFGTALGVAAYLGVKNGYLKGNIKYGAVPKVVVGVIIGYFMGKFSYQKKCMEKLMQLPNSQLAEVLRRRQRGGMMETITGDSMGMGLSLSPFSPSKPDVYTDEHLNENKSNALNLDTDRPSFSGLDDIYRPSIDNPSYKEEPEAPSEPVKPVTTYEKLRQRNREEYLRRHQNHLRRPISPESSTAVQQDKPREDTESPIVIKNKYGDTWTG